MAIKAIVLLATLKKHELSNTETLCDFLLYRMVERDIECDMVKLVDCRILPGTYTNMGDGDEWPGILDKILASDIIIFATPIWWGGHSSEIQRAIERLDGLHDEILAGIFVRHTRHCPSSTRNKRKERQQREKSC